MTPEQLWEHVVGEPCPREITVHGDEPMLEGPFLVGTAAAACVGAVTAAAAEYHEARGGVAGAVSVDMAHAAESFRSEAHLAKVGEHPRELWGGLSGDYRCADGWVKLHCNYPQHADVVREAFLPPAIRGRTVQEDERDAVAATVRELDAQHVEQTVIERGGAAAAMRTRSEWLAHDQGTALSTLPLVDFRRIGAAQEEPTAGPRPLSGIRVLDLTHVIAGPVCGRVLAAHGADVLRIDAEHLPTLGTLLIDTGFGKRSAYIDLRTEQGRAKLRELVTEADVLVQSYRPGSLAAKGFDADTLSELNPRIVTVDLNAYGWTGPWAQRRGFDSLVQMACGIAEEGARFAGVDEPRPLPAQALDHGTGWLAAFAVLTALRARLEDGGSCHVRLALARTGRWLDSLGRKESADADIDVLPYLAEDETQFGRIRHVRVPGVIEGVNPYWANGAHRRGADIAAW